jgi:class 3 adenylate cyclase/tetratricopeptide (TPR) repeat protein
MGGVALVCSNCGTENRAGRKFCLQCGSPLAISCPNCGAVNEAESRFCGECGTSFETKPSEPGPEEVPESDAGGAERRLVSVLFADLVGFTAQSEHRDPEEVRELLSAYFETARELIGRYGGSVEKFIGDAVMAVWGAPVAHEDDAERAVRAGLDLVAAVAALGAKLDTADMQLRASVLTGEAAVTIGAQGQGMVAGDLVNTASRLQSVAAAGSVLVGESTYLATKGSIAFEDGGQHVVKGKELPLKAWKALRVTAGRRGTRWTDVLEPPFVGRDEEFRLVKELFHATAREGKPRLLSVMGIGGIGKSRLAWEFFKYIDGLAEEVAWHQGRSPAYGDGLTFWALGEMVRMRARIAETDDAASTLAKLQETIANYVPEESDRRWMLPRLSHLLGIEQGQVGEREELFTAWRSFFERISERSPVVLLFEDIQWADPGLLDFIEHVLEWSRNRSIFIVTLARPELMDRRPTWGAGQRNFTSLHLEPLPEAAIRSLLMGLASGLPETVVEQVLDRAEGVPLYAVESVRMLVDQGHLVLVEGTYRLSGPLDRLEVPDTLHALIAARLDGLDTKDRSLLQDGSILGKTFTVEALAAVSGEDAALIEPRLRALVRKELLSFDVDPRSPERGQFGFVQTLIREVAYQTLSKRDRRRLHLTAAHYFEGLGDDELASVVATHYMEAYRASTRGPDADALAARAQDALVTAAERASSLGSHTQAQVYLEQAIAVVVDPTRRAELLQLAGEAALRAADHEPAERYLREAIERFRATGDFTAAARATVQLSRVLTIKLRVEDALGALNEAAEHLPSLDDDRAGVELAAETARAYMMHREDERAAVLADRAAAAAERLDLVDVLADALVTYGTALDGMGRVHASTAVLRGAVEFAREHELSRPLLRGYFNLAFRLLRYYPQAAFDAATAGAAVASKLGLREFQISLTTAACASAFSLGNWERTDMAAVEFPVDELDVALKSSIGLAIAEVAAFRGEWGRADPLFQEIWAYQEAGSSPENLGTALLFRGEVAFVRGRFEEALERWKESASLTGAMGDFAWPSAARAALWAGRQEDARAAIARIPGGIPGSMTHAISAVLKACVASLEGRRSEAIAMGTHARTELKALGAEFELALADLDLARFVGPDSPEGEEAADEARAIFTRLRALPLLERLDDVVRTVQPA